MERRQQPVRDEVRGHTDTQSTVTVTVTKHMAQGKEELSGTNTHTQRQISGKTCVCVNSCVYKRAKLCATIAFY